MHRQRVVVHRDASLVAADERHDRAALPLTVQKVEIADDHAEGVQVPAQGTGEHPRLQDQMTEPLNP
jgi:hypothetical protein